MEMIIFVNVVWPSFLNNLIIFIMMLVINLTKYVRNKMIKKIKKFIGKFTILEKLKF